jgi:hypothetical protein
MAVHEQQCRALPTDARKNASRRRIDPFRGKSRIQIRKIAHWRPDSAFCFIVQHPHLRTSESKDASNLVNSVALSEVRN